MTGGHGERHSRRAFLGATMGSLILHGCGGPALAPGKKLPEKPRLNTGRSTVAIARCESYEEDALKIIKPLIEKLDFPDLHNKTVVIKPNMVEYRPGRPVTTNPEALKAAVELAAFLGARDIVVGEGPGHMRDTEFLLAKTGLGPACKQLGVRFVDLNFDDIEKVDNSQGLTHANHFYLPRTIVEADAVISLPKLKTHHWVGMTASMKNLFGSVPGRKYGWPKNPLHWLGIPETIIDLVCLVKPAFALVDGVVAMEGDGPINGQAKPAGVFVLGKDAAAVDATCARTIGVDPRRLKYLELAERYVGNIDSKDIDIIGDPVASVQKAFTMPINFAWAEGSVQAARQDS